MEGLEESQDKSGKPHQMWYQSIQSIRTVSYTHLDVYKRQTIHIPQRQFIGESRELDKKIEQAIDKEIEDIISK